MIDQRLLDSIELEVFLGNPISSDGQLKGRRWPVEGVDYPYLPEFKGLAAEVVEIDFENNRYNFYDPGEKVDVYDFDLATGELRAKYQITREEWSSDSRY